MTRLLTLVALSLSSLVATAETRVVVIEGLAGEPRYGEQFERQVSAIATAAQSITSDSHVHVLRGDDVSRDAVLQRIDSAAAGIGPDDWFACSWLGMAVLITTNTSSTFRAPT